MSKIIALLVAVLAILSAGQAEARHRHHHRHHHARVAVQPCWFFCQPAARVWRHHAEAGRPRRLVSRHRSHHHARVASRPSHAVPAASAGVGLSEVLPELAAKVKEIIQECGSQVVSAIRHTFVAGTRTWSLHHTGRAVDIAGNPSCIYGKLAGWRGGYSVDYARVRHVHLSLGGREDGARFVHGGGHRRYAHRHRRHKQMWATAARW